MNKDNIIALVVAYNVTKEAILENIKSYVDFVDKVLIVDNSDKESSLEELSSEKIKYISLNGNYGIAKALNVGCSWAIENNYKYVLTMDQDSKFSNNLIQEYSKFEKNDVIIYSPKYLISRKRNKEYKEDTQELYWTFTSGNILNLELYQKNGKFIEEFFIDGVDYEYCLRARKNNYKILQCNRAELIHNPGIEKTKKILFWDYKYGYMSQTRLYYQVRNLSKIAKDYKSLRAYLVILMKLSKIILLFDNKKQYLKAFKEARRDFKNNKFGKRNNINGK